jgi:hypothetical protein
MKGRSSEEQRDAAVMVFATGWRSKAVASKVGVVGKLSSGCTTVQSLCFSRSGGRTIA